MRIHKFQLLWTLTVILVYLVLYIFIIRKEYRDVVSQKNKHAVDNIQIQNIVRYRTSTKGAVAELDTHVSVVGALLQNVIHKKTSDQRSASEIHIEMLSVYENLKFDNIDGGVWKQGWNIKYNDTQWNTQNKLKVFVVPHSHNDPGWKKSFEEYYQRQTRSILNNMVTKLLEDKRRKFIWAEISFFSLWWQEISEEIKRMVKLLLARGQLEIVTGGWVMNDEANTHYYSIIQQLTHGHQWMQQHLNVTPRFGWAIDPFGHSPTMPYVLKKMGLEALLIQRTHYCVKKYLAMNKQLEFRWRQKWDVSGKTDFLSHMMPFYSYDIPHTCGPDPKICCQFDFLRLPGYGVICPWGIPAQLITDSNVEFRAQLLLDQYRKKSQLYSTNVLLVPLGDDFRYDKAFEWDIQYNNYQKLFDYINNNPSLHTEVQFGTLSDYFEAVSSEKSVDQFPSLSGDFFTYADKDDNYWSGYYTSRPFYKRMDRELQAYLRGADILFTLGCMEATKTVHRQWLTGEKVKLLQILQDARSSLSLFQHHDGITGTAKDHVVQDYAKKLYSAIHGCQHVMQQVAHYLLSPSKEDYEPSPDFQFFNMDDIRRDQKSLSEQWILTFKSDSAFHKVILYNSLTCHRTEVVSFRVETPNVKVRNSQGIIVNSQVSPLCQLTDLHVNCYLLSFVAEVKPLGLATYFVEKTTSEDNNRAVRTTILVLNAGDRQLFIKWVKDFDNDKEFSVQNDKVIATFNADGLLKALTMKSTGRVFPINLSFVKYGTLPGQVHSGAYLFIPNGHGKIIHHHLPLILVLEGPVVSRVVVWLPHVLHSVILYNSPGADGLGLEIHNLVDIIGVNKNYELSMRLTSNINNGDTFYTDVNGFQMIQRRKFNKLPIQAHFYPMPSAAYIEDEVIRLSIASAQPLGVTSLEQGQIEVMQDRRLFQDDNRGLDQGVLDNMPTLTMFRLLVEQKTKTCSFNYKESYMSGVLYLSLYSLNYPVHHMVWLGDTQTVLKTFYSAVTKVDIDVHLVSLSTLVYPNTAVGVILHRVNVDSCFKVNMPYELSSNGQVNLSSLLPTMSNDKLYTASLSFLSVGEPQNISEAQTLHPMDLQAFLIPK